MTRFLALLFAVMLAACSGDRDALPQGTLVRLSEADVRSLDPIVLTDIVSARIAMDQFEGLTRYNGKGEVVGALAESWSASPNGLSWTFRLRPDLRFSDGEPITAALYPELFKRIGDEKNPSPHYLLYTAVAAIEAPDPGTVVIRLKQPFPELPALFAHQSMAAVPLHRIAKLGDRWTAERPMVVSGPYRVTDWVLNRRILTQANPLYYGGKPRIAKVMWRPMDDRLSSMRTFLAGEGDIAQDFPANRAPYINARAPGSVHVFPMYGTFFISLNTRKAPLDNRDLRLAMALTVERGWIVKMLESGNPPAWGMIADGMSGLKGFKPEWADWSRDRRLATARALMSRAGYGPDRRLTLEMRFATSPAGRRLAVALQQMWAPLGIDLTLLNSEAQIHFATMQLGDFQTAVSGWLADLPAPENMLAIHRVDAGPANYSGYASRDYVRLLDAAMDEAGPSARAAKMRVAEQRLIADMPIIPVYSYSARALVGPRVVGWNDNLADMHPSVDLALTQ